MMKKLLKFVVLSVPIGILFIGIIGYLKSGIDLGDLSKEKGLSETLLEPVYSYAAMPVSAISAYSIFSLSGSNGWGGASFPFLAINLSKIGVPVNPELLDYFGEGRDYVARYFRYELSSTHATYIPPIVKDVGEKYVWLGAMILCFLFQACVLASIGKDRILAGTFFLWGGYYGAAMSSQTNMFGVTIAIYSIIFGLAYYWWCTHGTESRIYRRTGATGSGKIWAR
jgi:hypothetical protein